MTLSCLLDTTDDLDILKENVTESNDINFISSVVYPPQLNNKKPFSQHASKRLLASLGEAFHVHTRTEQAPLSIMIRL